MRERTFTNEDQIAFAALSGDFNPMHVDPTAARRLLFGAPVVHGVHCLLWALDVWGRTLPASTELTHLRVDFLRPVMVDKVVRYDLKSQGPTKAEVVLHSEHRAMTRIRLGFCPARNAAEGDSIECRKPPREICDELAESQLIGLRGTLPLLLDRKAALQQFPDAIRKLPARQIASLCATTRLVGMKCPGLHSIYSRLDMRFDTPATSGHEERTLDYVAAAIDERFHLATIDVKTACAKGVVRAFIRPRPRDQIDFDAAKKLVKPGEFSERRAWVIGGSRGLGEVTSKLLAAGGAEVIVTYHSGEADAARVVQDIKRGGGSAAHRRLDVLAPPNVQEIDHREAPTDLFYFATPYIEPGTRENFSAELFNCFVEYYVVSFIGLVRMLAPRGLKVVFSPSSVYVSDPPETLLEYAAAKGAAEVACMALRKAYPQLAVAFPRLDRMATDQTASLSVAEIAQEPTMVLLDEIRTLTLSRFPTVD